MQFIWSHYDEKKIHIEIKVLWDFASTLCGF